MFSTTKCKILPKIISWRERMKNEQNFGIPKNRNNLSHYLGNISKHCVEPKSKIVFHQRVSSIKGRLPSKVIFHTSLSFLKGCLPSKVIFHQRPSSIIGHLPSKDVFHQWSSSIKGPLSSKVVFHQRWSSIVA